MPRPAAIPIRTLAAGERCFIRQKYAFVDRVLRPVRQRLEAPEVVESATGVMTLTARILCLGDDIEPKEWSRCIGIRNSHDRTIAVGLSAGISVHVCSNLCFGGSTVLKRRHTSRIELNGLVLEAVNALELEFLTLENVAEELKIDELNDDEVRASLVVAAERQAIPSCDILTVWKEFKHPRHEEFAEPTRWSLLNAFTETAKKYSPARADQCYRSLTRLFGLDGKPAELWK